MGRRIGLGRVEKLIENLKREINFDGTTFTGGNAIKIAATTTAASTSAIKGITSTISPYIQGTTQLYPLGTELVYGERKFRYAFFNGAVTAGLLVQQAAHLSDHTQMAVIDADAATLAAPSGVAYSHAVGSRAICVDTIGTNMVADNYAEGFLHANDDGSGTGQGQLLKIRTHKAHVHGTSPSVVIETYDPLTTVILKNVTEFTAIKNPYKDVVVSPTTETGAIVGATVIDMTDDNYGWICVSGPASLLISEAAVVIGNRVVRSDADAGGVMAANSDPLLVPVGQVMGGSLVDTEYAMVWLNIQ
jgi:hypothetical protein